MKEITSTIILIEDDKHNIETLRNMLRTGGVLVDLQIVSRARELTTKYKNGCDLIIISSNTTLIALDEIKSIVNDENAPILCLGKNDADLPSAFIKKGAVYFAHESDNEYVVYVIQECIKHTRGTRELEAAKINIKNISKRSNELISETLQPIAYLSSGFFTFTNEAFKDYFGAQAIEDSLSFADFLSTSEQKKFLSSIKKVGKTQASLDIQLSIDNPNTQKTETLNIALEPITYEGEACVKLLIVQDNNNLAEINNEVSEINEELNKELDEATNKLDKKETELTRLQALLDKSQKDLNASLKKAKADTLKADLKADTSKEDTLKTDNSLTELNKELDEKEKQLIQLQALLDNLQKDSDISLKKVMDVEARELAINMNWERKYETVSLALKKATISLSDKKTPLGIEASTGFVYQKRLDYFHKIQKDDKKQAWFVLFNLTDLRSIWRRYGSDVSDRYMSNLVNMLIELQGDAQFIEYADTGLLAYFSERDLQTINTLTDALRSQIDGFSQVLENGTKLFSRCKSEVLSISNSSEPLLKGLAELEFKTGLFGNMSQDNDSLMNIDEDTDVDNIIFNEMGLALEAKRAQLTFIPIARFGSIDNSTAVQTQVEYYMAGGRLMNLENEEIEYKTNQVSDITNSCLFKLDQWIIENLIQTLAQIDEPNKCILINLSLSSVTEQGFAQWLVAIASKPNFPAKHLAFGVSEHIFKNYNERVLALFEIIRKLGVKIWIAGFAGENVSLFVQNKFDIVMISERLINRVSRSRDSQLKSQFKDIIDDLNKSHITAIAAGVDAPAQMALVWEYNIPLALGNMISHRIDRMNFDFSSMLV
ncbi:hypothetical protein AwWohl_11810 [Gammaproteobacteria bacterium]|nr:hypothetical protein AwWohl_11810 [Gammaproteobacteria bacterium]